MKRFLLLAALLTAAAAPRSGYDDASAETRAMQDDDDANPGFLWVREGEVEWSKPAGTEAKSCASCHGDATQSMRGVAARYPMVDAALSRPITLDQRIAQCRTERQHAEPLPPEHVAALGLSAYVGLQSRGMPINVPADGPFVAAGRRLFETRMGQLNLSCAQCHDERAGMKLGGAIIPQGQPNGYPEYRLQWQSLGTLNRRLRDCMTGVRAEPFPPDSLEAAELALFLAVRAAGLTVEIPAVRP
jgi:L-cysteine S-thiosulfotransferase